MGRLVRYLLGWWCWTPFARFAVLDMEQIVLGPAEEAADVGALVIKTELGIGSLD